MGSIIVFGASGPVGGFLLGQLPADQRIHAVSREHHTGSQNWIRADLNDANVAWPDADVVISLGPLDAFAQWLQVASPRTLRRVIALSSMSAESKRDSTDPRERELAARLRDAEARALDTCHCRNIACTLFRPTLIYGAGTDRSLAPIARFARRWRILPIPVGAIGLRQPIHAADIACACASVLTVPATFGRIYPLGGGERLQFDAMMQRLRHASPGFVLPVAVPLPFLRFAARYLPSGSFSMAMVARMRKPLIADNTEAIRDFAFEPRKFCADQVLPIKA